MKRTSKMTKGIFTMLLGLTLVAFTSQVLAQTTISFSTAGPGTVTFFAGNQGETRFEWFDCPGGSLFCETDPVTLEPDVLTVVSSVAALQVTQLGLWSPFDREDAVLFFDFTVGGQTVTLRQASVFQFVGQSSDPQWRYIAFPPSTTETIDLGGGQLLEVTLLPWGGDFRVVGQSALISAELVLRGQTAEAAATDAIDEAIDEILALPRGAFQAPGHQNALSNILRDVIDAIAIGDIANAINLIENAISRTDGCALRGSPDGNGPGRDFIIDCASQDLVYPPLVDALAFLTGL